MTLRFILTRRRLLLAAVLVFSAVQLCWAVGGKPSAAKYTRHYGPVVWEEKSQFSQIRVRRRGSIHTLLFVHDSGKEALESRVNTRRPHELLSPYTRAMFASYLFQPNPKRVLVVGLGGGAMIHFFRRHDPSLRVDVVEIDPAIVRIADKYFAVRSEKNVKIITADGIDYLQKTSERYDVIYMDAFLKPSAETDAAGVPLGLKTAEFYKQVQQKLATGGLVVFNLNKHDQRARDLAALQQAFSQSYMFRVAKSTNQVLVGTTAKDAVKQSVLESRARELDRRFKKRNFTFRSILAGRAK